MKFKKFLAVISSAALSLSALSALNVNANLPNTPSAGDNCYLEFDMTADGAYITGAIDVEGNPTSVESIAIPEKTEAGIPIVGIKGFAFAECNNLETVTVPDTVTYIDDAAFLRTEDIDSFLEASGLDISALTAEDVAYAANFTSFMGKSDWTGDEDELADAVTVFNNVYNKITDSEVNNDGNVAKRLYNYQDLSDIVRSADEDTLEKMSMKSYESFLAWVATIPYVDITVKANEDSYGAKYAQGKTILNMKYEPLETHLVGDANQDGVVNVRDCAKIANALAFKTVDALCIKCADYNQDGEITVRDAAQLAAFLAKKK